MTAELERQGRPMPLTDTAVRPVKDKEYKVGDGRGLLVVERPTGAKWWRLRYRFQGTEKMISLGARGKVFRHAIGLGHAVRDITPDLRALLEAPTAEHHAALTAARGGRAAPGHRFPFRSLHDALRIENGLMTLRRTMPACSRNS